MALTITDFSDSIYRSHDINRSPIFYGRTGHNRFDAPDRSFAVLYAGRDLFCAFVETFARAAVTRVVTTTALRNKSVAELRPLRPLRLIDLTESGSLVRIGTDARLFSAEHAIAQRWSKTLHDHPVAADGLLYPSRLDPTRHGIALFEDRAPRLTELSRKSWYAPGPQRILLAQIIEHYGLELIETQFVPARKPTARSVQGGLFK